MSTEIAMPLVYRQISRVMSDIGAVSKDRKNEQQKYSFRGIEDFYQAAHPAMIKHGVFCAPEVLEREEYRFEKTNDFNKVTTWLHVAMKVRHRFFAEDGSFVDVITCGEGLDNSDKASNKAMSGAMKYALIELFCVPTKDIEDSDRETLEQGTRRKPVEKITEAILLTRSAAPTNGSGTVRNDDPPVKAAETLGTVSPSATPRAEDAHAASAVPASVEYIAIGAQKNFHKSFRLAVPVHRKLDADNLCYQWLTDNGYVNDKKEPTAAMIPAAGWLRVRDEAVAWAAARQ